MLDLSKDTVTFEGTLLEAPIIRLARPEVDLKSFAYFSIMTSTEGDNDDQSYGLHVFGFEKVAEQIADLQLKVGDLVLIGTTIPCKKIRETMLKHKVVFKNGILAAYVYKFDDRTQTFLRYEKDVA